MSMNPEIKAQWVTDLCSGEYEQGKGYLNADGKLCCLGVLCEQAVNAGVIEKETKGGLVVYDGQTDALPLTVIDWAGLPPEGDSRNPTVYVEEPGETGDVTLAELNDGENGWRSHSFDEIADLIDEQL